MACGVLPCTNSKLVHEKGSAAHGIKQAASVIREYDLRR